MLSGSLRRQCLFSGAVLAACLVLTDSVGAEGRTKAGANRKSTVSTPSDAAKPTHPLRAIATPPAAQPTLHQELKKSRPASDVQSRKAGRRSKATKKPRAVASPKPKPDLSYHGILYEPQRYDPSRGHRKISGAPNPHAGELVHDHFQELDKNRDGSIDPVERTFGRLDMDRDLANRRWQ